jgi:outer membrane lipoprotein-sorting protein
VRTEDDLRTALTTLERHAPAAARVLPGSSRRARHGLRSPLSARWLAGITTAAALAGAVTALTLPGGTERTIQNGGVASPSATTGTTAKAKLLAAFSAASGDIAHTRTTQVNTSPDVLTDSGESWIYPWQASIGQQVHNRQVRLGSDGTPVLDRELIYNLPAPPTPSAPQPLGTKGSMITVNYKTKTWSEESGGVCDACQLTPTYLANLTELIKDNDFKEVGRTTVDGRRAIEFHAVELGDHATLWLRVNSTLWVDAATYLPLRLTSAESLRHGYTDTTTIDYQLLPATPANLAKLTPPVPAGFRKVADAQ